jgi:iron complex outermembrane receptor protein
MKKTLFISFLSVFFLLSEMVSGQDGIIIQGKVTDINGNPLVGANIIILNSSFGASTDAKGFYFIELPPSQKGQSVQLEVSYVGYITQSTEITLSTEKTIHNFVLEENILSLKKVFVSAQRREENLQTVPISITAIESDKIQNRGANQVIDLRYTVPNLTFGTGASYAYGMITSIRGIAGTSFIAGVEPRSAVYVDDVYTGRTISFNQDLMEIERVTVLRGPQGTLFGKNSISGLINISTRKPHGKWEGSVVLEGGNYKFLSTKVLLNIPFIENKLFTKVAGKFSRKDGYVTNLYNDKNMNGEKIIGGRLQARYLASDALEFLLNFDGFQNTMDPRTEAIINDGSNINPREISHDAEEFDYLNLYRLAFTADYRILNGHYLKSISAFGWNNNRNQFDLDVSPQFVAFGDWRDTTRLFTQEFRLTSPSNKFFDYVAGLYYVYQGTDKTSTLNTGPEFPVPEYKAQSKAIVKTNSIAGYLNGNLSILKNLVLSAGLRYTYEYKTVKFDLINDPEPIFYIDVDNYEDTYSKSVLSPKIGLNFSLWICISGFYKWGMERILHKYS